MRNGTQQVTVVGILMLSALFASCSNGSSRCWKEVHVGDSNTDFSYLGVWGSSEDNVVVVGDSDPVVFDGEEWIEQFDASGCSAVWGASETEVYAACGGRRILKLNGEGWLDTGAEFRGFPEAVWGSSSEDIYVVGYHQESASGPVESVIVHFDGELWSEVQNEFTIELKSVWGASSDDIFAVGHVGATGGAILHYNGASWEIVRENLPHSLQAVFGVSASSVFAVGGGGYILHFDGNEWLEIESGTVGELRAVWAASEGDAYIGGSGTLMHYSRGTLSDIAEIVDFGVNGIWGASRDDVFLVGLRHIDSNPVAHVLRNSCSIDEQLE